MSKPRFDPKQFRACLVEIKKSREEALGFARVLEHGRAEIGLPRLAYQADALQNEINLLGELITAVDASTEPGRLEPR